MPAAPGPGGGSADLELNQDHIGEAGSEACMLPTRLSTDGKHAAASTAEGAGALTREGFASGAALLKAARRFHGLQDRRAPQVTKVSGTC
ncbi:hypothetical protein [Streptomyces sp. NPDC056401]|uniref:hypothetical protein n=1 Tax=Streptomyces sp. NPDC056401 TaxID=3345809 RepID=UPI0035D75783